MPPDLPLTSSASLLALQLHNGASVNSDVSCSAISSDESISLAAIGFSKEGFLLRAVIVYLRQPSGLANSGSTSLKRFSSNSACFPQCFGKSAQSSEEAVPCRAKRDSASVIEHLLGDETGAL